MKYIRLTIKSRTSVYAIIIMLFLFIPIHAQFLNYRFDRIGTKDGLPDASVNYIIQDSRGFMWFATYGGLCRYDGYTFKNYLYDPKDPDGLSNQNIVYLYEDKEGMIWVVNSGRSGLDRYDPVYDKFTHFEHDPFDTNSISDNDVKHVMEDKQGNLWISTSDAINLFVEDNGKVTFKRYPLTIPNISTKFLYETTDSVLLLFSPLRYEFNIKEKQLHFIPDSFIQVNHYDYVLEDENGNFITINDTAYLNLKYNREEYRFEVLDYFKLDPSLTFQNVLTKDHNDNLWIGNASNGLFRYNRETKELLHFQLDEFDDYSLSDNRVVSLFIDKTGVLWIGTTNQGVCKLDLYGNKISHYKKNKNHPLSLSGNLTSSISGINNTELWIALESEGGVNNLVFDDDDILKKVIPFKHDPGDPGTIIRNDASCLIQRKNGEVWAGFRFTGVSRIFPEKYYIGKKQKIKNYGMNSWSFSLFEDSEQILWGGTWGGGLWQFKDTTEEFIYFINNPSDSTSICDEVIWAIGEDKYKNLWIGGNGNGISILTHERKFEEQPAFINYSYKEGNPFGLNSNTINAFLQHSDGTMWIATSGGLSKVLNSAASLTNIDEKELKFRTYTIKDGLPSDLILGIVEDLNGDIWLSTSNGISYFDLKDSTFTNYYENDGFQGNNYFHNSYFINKKGRIFFGGVNGFSAFYPENVKANPFIPDIQITGIEIFNEDVEVGKEIRGSVILEKSITELSEITISHKNNFITIEFASMHYANTKQNQFAYYLEGYEEDWNYMEGIHSATYMNLKPGEYIFRVKGSNNNGIWNETGDTLKITVKPPFWNTLMAKIIYVILVTALFFLFNYIRLKRIKNKNIYLEKMVLERTQELSENNKLLIAKSDELNETNTILEERQQKIEEQAEELSVANEQLSDSISQLSELNAMKDKFFSIIGHDLKNPVNVIIGFSEILKSKIDRIDVEKRNSIIEHIIKASKHTYGLLENLLEWARSQSGRLSYAPDNISMSKVIKENLNLLKDHAANKNINLTFDDKTTNDIIYCDEKMISTVVRNLISNAIKFTPEGGQISIFFQQQNGKTGKLTMCVQDNGVGIPEKELPNIFKLDNKYNTEGTSGEEGTGLGLILCHEFIEKNQGKIWVESTVKVGTRFYISLPLSQNNQ